MAPPLIQLSDIALTFGGTPLLDGAELSVSAGERVCLVGRNGSGKSTLLKIAAGLIEPDRGTRFVQPGATRPLSAAGARSRRRTPPRWPMWRPASAPADDPHQARYLLEQLGLTGERGPRAPLGRRGAPRRARARAGAGPRHPAARRADQPPRPAGHRMARARARRRSARALVTDQPRPPLPRQPVAHHRLARSRQDPPHRARLSRRSRPGATRCSPRRSATQHKLDRKIVAEEHWVRYGVTARRKRNMRRIGELAGAAPGAARAIAARPGSATIAAAQADKSGTLVIEADGIAKSFGGRPIVADFSIRVHARRPHRHRRPERQRQDHAGQSAHRRARARRGQRAARRQPRDGDARPAVARASIPTGRWRGADRRARRHVDGRRPDEARRRLHEGLPVRARAGAHAARVLSGGERGRLMLARALAKPSNVLVLDEPTNDLDLETLDVLEEMLADYAGTVILISHDRDFLDRVVECGDRSRGRRALDRVCRRLHRHAGAARRRTLTRAPTQAGDAEGGERGEGGEPPRDRKPAKRKLELSREARARDVAEDDRRAAARKCAPCTDGWTIPASMRATARPSTRNLRRARRRTGANWPPPRRSGWSWRYCARRSRADKRSHPYAPPRGSVLFALVRLPWSTDAFIMRGSVIEGDCMSDVRIAAAFDANLPNLDRTVRISSFYDAQVFVRRWAIRDKDRVIRALLRRMERANSSEAANSAIEDLKRELAARGLLPDPAAPLH